MIGLQILTSDHPDNFSICAEHDQITAGTDLCNMSDETFTEIQKVDGWTVIQDLLCTKHRGDPVHEAKVVEEMRKCETCRYTRFSCYV